MTPPPPPSAPSSRLPPGAIDRKALAEKHLGMVKAQAIRLRQHLPAGFEVDDLVGFGSQGLMEAAERFDPTRGLKFSTFAYYRIRGAMFDGLRELGPYPRWAVAGLRAAEGMDDYLENAADRQAGADPRTTTLKRPTTAQTLKTVADHVAGITTIVITSLEAHEGDDARVADPNSERPFEQLDGLWRHRVVRDAVLELTADERRLIQLCYDQGMTLKEAGAELGRSRSWASRLHCRAINHLREILGTDPLPPPRLPP